MTPVTEAKWAALAQYKCTPIERNLQILRIARNKAQQTARRCTNKYWTELSENIQSAAITGNIRGIYNGIKKALGPTLNKTAPLRSSTEEVITDRGHQLERWVEHYSDIYSRENIMAPSALDAVECLPTMEELDTEPTLEELSKAIDSLASGKAPGSDGIPPDLLKHCKTTLLHSLHVLLCQCWQEGAVPQDMWDAKISHSSRTRRERSDCNNYRGISLAKSLQRSSWSDCRSWQNMSILNHSGASELEGQQQTWSSPFPNNRRSAENNRCPVYRFYWPHIGVWSRQQRQSLPDPPKDWLPSKIAEHDRILPHKHERDNAIQRQLLQALWHMQRHQTRVRPSPNALWNLLCPALETCLWRSIRRNLSADQIRWQALQSWLPQSQDKGSWSPHQRHAVRGRCSSDDPHPAGAAGTDGLFLSGLQGFWTNHQSEEDKRPGAGYNETASHHHRWLWARCRRTVHISWLHHHRQPLLGHWDW